MSKRKIKEQKENKGITRSIQKEAGFFDGRFVQRSETPKPKKKRYKTFRKKKHKGFFE